VPKGKLSTEFIVEVMARKFKQHDPIFRQLAALDEDHGIQIDRKTVNNAILATGELLIPVVSAQARELKAGGYLQADETPVPCQTREKTGRNHRSYIWEYSLPAGPVVFDFQMGRSRAGPEKFLKGFEGKVQCDGYAAYGGLGEKITWVGCMAHARRGFSDAQKLSPKDRLPMEVIGRIQELYVIEEEARQSGMSPEARLELRQKKSVPVMEGVKRRVTEIRQEIPPGSKLAQACGYMLGQWDRLEEYLKDGRVEIDNNWCEGGMRPIALGRKNWLHIGSEEAGPKIAAIMSIVETCRRLKINLREYLKEILPKLGQWPITRVGELTPTAWKATKGC